MLFAVCFDPSKSSFSSGFKLQIGTTYRETQALKVFIKIMTALGERLFVILIARAEIPTFIRLYKAGRNTAASALSPLFHGGDFMVRLSKPLI